MYDRDGVIRHVAVAAAAHADRVSVALADWMREPTASAEERLRAELVALSAGWEGSAHDGSTYETRRAAAAAALAAWDGPQLEQATETRLQIRASRVVWTSVWGVVVSTTGEVGHLPHGFEELLLLGVQATGRRDDAAVLWALAEKQRRREVESAYRSEDALASALRTVAEEFGQESAQSLVARMPERMRAYVREVWQRKG